MLHFWLHYDLFKTLNRIDKYLLSITKDYINAILFCSFNSYACFISFSFILYYISFHRKLQAVHLIFCFLGWPMNLQWSVWMSSPCLTGHLSCLRPLTVPLDSGPQKDTLLGHLDRRINGTSGIHQPISIPGMTIAYTLKKKIIKFSFLNSFFKRIKKLLTRAGFKRVTSGSQFLCSTSWANQLLCSWWSLCRYFFLGKR